jgi:hypothetical protein
MKKSIFSIMIVAVAMMSSISAFAQQHPAYLHALSDLRAARWMIEHRPSTTVKQTNEEITAIKEIDLVIAEIKKAAIDDHKDINDHVGVQEINDRVGRLRKAVELLKKTREDITQKEDNKFANGLRDRALAHINEAISLTERAIGAGK